MGKRFMTQKKEREEFVDDVKVDCKTWDDPVSKAEADEIESQLDFLSLYG